MSSPSPSARSPLPEGIGGRYRVLARLGRGGSAYVYRVSELASGRELALKRVRHDLSPSRTAELTRHLEREFYALSQLRHPRVIEVYDYGVSDALAYYTMELLEGGDLRAIAPLHFRRACELIYDVASSLALLHSRRFVHRDVTPANIRTTHDGRAKLIDFGAMTHMGPSTKAIGTPAYVAPEGLRRGVLDACTDVFSLGATLYFILTGRAPFAAHDLANMPSAWAVPPEPPSSYVAEIPDGLDALVLSMLSLEPAHRPRNAFEVMQRLAACAGLPVSESASVTQGYLSAPLVVGRDSARRSVRAELRQALLGHGGALWIDAEPGVGRSRLLQLCTAEAKTFGACVLRLDASEGGAAFAGARRLGASLLACLPERARAALPESPELHALLARGEDGELGLGDARPALHDALLGWLLVLSTAVPIVIAVDDVRRLDEPTLAWLAALAHAAAGTKLLLLSTAELAPAPSHGAAAVLQRHSTNIRLLPLTRAESDAMFTSVFGAVPNLSRLCERIFALVGGNPRRSLALAQHLVDAGHLTYAAGAWSLPDVLAPDALGVDFEALFRARLARLGTLARQLAETQALSLVAALRRDDYRVLAPEAQPRSLDDALTELIAHDVVRSDGTYYVLSERGYATVLEAQLAPNLLAERHRALAQLATQQHRHAYVIAYHELHAGREERALQLLVRAAETLLSDLSGLDPSRVRRMLERAHVASIALDRPQRERFELLRQLVMLSLVGEPGAYWRSAPVFRAQLEADSGLRAYWARGSVEDPSERLRGALIEAQARYADAPEHERVFRVDEALRLLALYVATSIAIGARTSDVALLRSLPGLLEPFVGLSPLLAAIWENVEATCDSIHRGRPGRGIERWQKVYAQLDAIAGDPRTATIRNAVAYGLGEVTASFGLASEATRWIERLDRVPLQRVNAMRVRRIVCLQHGDWAGAERAREQAELMALQASGPQIFEAPLRTELYAHWLARDLAGVKHTAERIGRLATKYPGWRPYERLAEGYFEALRGDAVQALQAFEGCIESTRPDAGDPDRLVGAWAAACAGALSMLNELGRSDEARERGERMLAQCAEYEVDVFVEAVECALALAEAIGGDAARASERVERVIADQRRRGVGGLPLGASYEARARVALYARNGAEYCDDLAARQHPQSGERARVGAPGGASPLARELTAALGDARGRDFAPAALELLCKRGEAVGGYLYLAAGEAASLELAAATLAPPSAALARFVVGFWEQQLEDAEMSAVLTELPWGDAPSRSTAFQDSNGDRFEAVLLYSPHARPTHVGLAVLGAGERGAAAQWPPTWLAALALQLTEAQ